MTAPSTAPTSASARTPRGRSRWDRAGSATGRDQSGEALDERLEQLLDRLTDRVLAIAELDPQRHQHARHVTSAVDGVTAGERDQRVDRVGRPVGGPPDLLLPGLGDPCHDRQRKVLLAIEEVVERSARAARVGRNALEHEVPIAVAREPPRGRLQQGVPRARPSVGLSSARA